VVVLLSALSVALLAAPAHGDDKADKKECAAAAEKAQRKRNEGKLREARDDLVTCSRAACPAVIRRDCEPWLSDLEGRLPTVVIRAKDGSGRDVVDVRVTIDGAVASESLDGKAIPIDPGVHVFKYERKGSATIEDKIVVREGEKSRGLDVTFDPEPAARAPRDGRIAPPAPSGGSIVPGAIVGGIGVLALGSFAYFYASAKGDIDALKADCAPRCASSRVDPIDKKILIADVSLGAGAVALGVAAYLVFSRPAPRRVEIGVAPSPGGAVAGVGGRF